MNLIFSWGEPGAYRSQNVLYQSGTRNRGFDYLWSPSQEMIGNPVREGLSIN
jgi:hypothetical protein